MNLELYQNHLEGMVPQDFGSNTHSFCFSGSGKSPVICTVNNSHEILVLLLWDYIENSCSQKKKKRKRMNLESYANLGISFVFVSIFVNKIISTIIKRNGKE